MHTLAQELQINVQTVSKSYNELIQRGVLEKRVGIGTFPSKSFADTGALRSSIIKKRLRALCADSKELKISIRELEALLRSVWKEKGNDEPR